MTKTHAWVGVILVLFLSVAGYLSFGTDTVWATRRQSDEYSLNLQQTPPTPFLVPPFYETAGMNSIFDHEYPIYLDEPTESRGGMIHNNGQRVVGPGYSGHNGIDFGISFRPILAAADGEVLAAEWTRPENRRHTYGLYVTIRHANNYYSRYAHLSSLMVSVGEVVTVRQIIGIGGSTGNTGNPPGPHLHFHVMSGSSVERSSIVNPYGWIGNPTLQNDPWSSPPEVGPVSYNLWQEFPAVIPTDVYTSGQPLTPPPPPNEADSVIIDDLHSHFQVTTGSCEREYATAYNGHLYYSFALSRTAPTCAVRWNLPLTHTNGGPGTYDVYANIPDRRSESEWATYQIRHQGISSEAIINQNRIAGDSWVLLGKYRFDWNSSEYIALSNVTIETTTVQIAFDAIMLSPASDGPQPTATPGPTPTPEPVTAVISATLNDLSRPSFLDANGHTSSVLGSLQALTESGRQFFRFNALDGDVERVSFSPSNNDLVLGNTADNSFTVDVAFRPAANAAGERVMVNALWDNGAQNPAQLAGWKLALDNGSRTLAFSVYDSSFISTTVNANLTYDPANPPWIRVKAIKDGQQDRLYLCTFIGAGAAQMTQGIGFTTGVNYWAGTTVDLGADYRSRTTDPLNPNTSWTGDLDEFAYKRGADYATGCTVPPTPTPTRTLTPTSTPVPATPRPAATVIHLPMNEGVGTPLADQANNYPVSVDSITVVPGTPGNGNARAFPQTPGYSRISFGRNDDYYLADSAVRSMTVELWFRYTGVAGLPTQTAANTLAQVNSFFRGWDLNFNPGTNAVDFNVYTGGTGRAAGVSIPSVANANEWVRVRAIKDGARGKLVLCTAVNGANWRVAEANFIGAIEYFRVTPAVTTSGTSLDLGVSYKNPSGLNNNWHGDLDEFLYTNRAEYTGGCQPIPTATPTTTRTVTATPTWVFEEYQPQSFWSNGREEFVWVNPINDQSMFVGVVVIFNNFAGNQLQMGLVGLAYAPYADPTNWYNSGHFWGGILSPEYVGQRLCVPVLDPTVVSESIQQAFVAWCGANGYTISVRGAEALTATRGPLQPNGTRLIGITERVYTPAPPTMEWRWLDVRVAPVMYGALQTMTPTVVSTSTATPTPTRTPTSTNTPSATAAPAFQESGGLVVMEAENFDGNVARSGDTWVLRSDVAGYVGGGFMRTEPDDSNSITSNIPLTSPELNYRININTPGTYSVWLRVYGDHGGSDSIHVGLNGQTVSATTNIGFGGTGSWRWTGGGARQMVISAAGLHTLNVWMREDGARVDRIVLTTDGNYTPSGNGPAESPRTGSSPTATPTPSRTLTATPTRTNTLNGPTPTATATSSSGSLPNPWVSADVGSVGLAGSASYSGGTFTVNGSGADIWGTSDGFQFVYQPITGDLTLTARVMGLSNTNGWAKAGVMIRENLSAESRHAMTAMSYSNGVAFQRRVATGGSSTHTGGAFVSAPYWVRLVRSGSTLTGYQSNDGVIWQVVDSETITLPATVYVGLAVTAHNNSVLNAATFANITLSGAGASTPTPTLTPAPTSTPGGVSCLATNALDNFNRAAGVIGINWSGATGGYSIASNRLDVGSGRDIYWNATTFGATQEVCVTLVMVDTTTIEIGLILKSQVRDSQDPGLIEVAYNPYNGTDGQVEIWTYTSSQGWVWRGNVVTGFANGDRFGARATAAGQVEVYKNGIFLGSKSVTAWPYYAGGGYIGLWMAGDGSASDTLIDDFGGGTVQ